MRWTREEYISLMTFGGSERQMFVELFGPLIGLPEEWRAQGASQDEIDMIAFDWDYVPRIACGGDTGPFGTPDPVTLEDTAEYQLIRDHLGRTTKLPKGRATIALPQDFPVTDMDSWLEIKPYFTYRDERIDWERVEKAREAQKHGVMVTADIPGGFDIPRELMGEVVACLSYYEQPELMADIMQTLTETSLRVLEQISEVVTIDQLAVHEDMAGKSGPLVGPRQVNRWIVPYYRAIWDLLSSRGTRIFQQDSDGNMAPVIDAFIAGGVTVFYPCEPAAGMDVVQLRQRYGQTIAFKGGLDKMALRGTREDIRRELEYKTQPLMQHGGMVFGLDHRIPNGVPIENYRYYVDLGRELLGLPPREPGRMGWQRMA